MAEDAVGESQPLKPEGEEAGDALHRRYVADLVGTPEKEFLDDLSALNRFKTFLIGKGVEVPEKVVATINNLAFVFAEDLARYEQKKADKPASAEQTPADPAVRDDSVRLEPLRDNSAAP